MPIDGSLRRVTARHDAMDADGIEKHLLHALAAADATGVNTVRVAETLNVDHQVVVGVTKRLVAASMVIADAVDKSRLALTAEGEQCVELGSPEARAFACVPGALRVWR